MKKIKRYFKHFPPETLGTIFNLIRFCQEYIDVQLVNIKNINIWYTYLTLNNSYSNIYSCIIQQNKMKKEKKNLILIIKE